MRSMKLGSFDVEESASGAPASPKVVAGPRIAYSYTVTYAFDRRTAGRFRGSNSRSAAD